MISNELNDFPKYNPFNMFIENNDNNMDNSGYFSDNNNYLSLNNNYFNSFFNSHDSCPNNEIFQENNYFIENINTKDNTNEELNNNKSDNMNDSDINDNNIIKDNIKVDNIEIEIDTKENNKQNNKFSALKIGRPKKSQENKEQRFHNKNSFDNARKKIYNSCKTSIYDFIHKYIPYQLGIKLHVPTIEKQIGYSYQNNIKFFQKTIYKIFCESSPKRVKNEIKDNRSEYNYNQIMIDMLIEQENNDPTKQEKILKALFDLKFIDFLMLYLHDAEKLNIGHLNIDLKGFKTFGQCFNENKNKYTQSQKNMYKKHIIDIIENKKNNRKPRAIIHNNK